ncbi:MAG: hypothetical protein ACK5PS_08420 [Desulfopila sp.]
MKIFILGLGKSGTTAMVYKVAGGLPGCRAFSGGQPGKHLGDFENAVYKHTYEERKGKGFDLYTEHLQNEQYDRKIWMARDPRDAAVSRMLYRWHRGVRGHKEQYRTHLALVQKKERDPASVPFHEICRHSGHGDWPRSTEAVLEAECARYGRMTDFVASLGSDWHLFTFEQMVKGDFAALNAFLGFEIKSEAEVAVSTGKAKVVRKKASGDWRHWFTEEDIELFKPVYTPYLERIGYDANDWELSPRPVIEPEYASEYMQNLVRRVPMDELIRFRNKLFDLFR